jgi:signal transduction histidine kinase
MSDLPAASPGVFSPSVLRRLPAIFLPAALLTGAVVLALYLQELSSEHALYEQAADHQVDRQADILRREARFVGSDLLYLANQSVLAEFLAGRPGSRRELQAEYALFCRQRGVYDQIRYLDEKGRERIRVNFNSGRPAAVPQRELQSKADRYYFAQTLPLGPGQVFISPFDLNVEHDAIERPLKPMIRFATPVFDARGAKRGILILNYLGAELLARLAEGSAAFPGAVWLLDRDGFFLRGPSAEDEWGFMLGHDRTFATRHPDEWPRISSSPRGRLHTRAGLFTFRTLSLHAPSTAALPADATDLVIVARVAPEVLEGRALSLLLRLLLLSGVVLALVFVLAWYLAYAGALRRDHERRLTESADRLRTLSARLLTAQEDERRSVSRDLHDELGQVVTSVTIDLQRLASASSAPLRTELIDRALRGAECLLDRIHEISGRLRPAMLDDLGLKDAVQNLLSEFEQRTGVATRAELHFEQAPAPPAVSENVYRILQEALTNVSRHARASEVFVGVRLGGGTVALTVRDDGVGLPPGAPEGKRLGIPGMRERTELLNGVFALKGEPGRGTEVSVTIPLSGAPSPPLGAGVGG